MSPTNPTVHNIAVMALMGFVLWWTGSLWSLLVLLLIVPPDQASRSRPA